MRVIAAAKLGERDPVRLQAAALRKSAAAKIRDQVAEIRFRYLGPTPSNKPLASGELRREIALKHESDARHIGAFWKANAPRARASHKCGQVKCCNQAEIVKTQFRVSRAHENHWFYLTKENKWKRIPPDIIDPLEEDTPCASATK